MITQLIERIFGPGKHAAADLVVRRVEAVSGECVPAGKVLCVGSGSQLLNCYPETLPLKRENETWWLVAADDLACHVELELNGSRLAVTIDVRVETDADVMKLLADRHVMTRDDVVSLLTSQLYGLLEGDEELANQSLTQATPEQREALRARLSLLLHCQGMRCTGIGPFTHIERSESVPTGNPTGKPAGKRKGESAGDPLAEEVAEHASAAQLQQVVEAVGTAEQWDELAAAMEETSPLTQQSAEEIAQLGDAVLDGSVNASEAAHRLRQIVRETARQASIADVDLQRFRGLDLRLLTGEAGSDANEAAASRMPVPSTDRPRFGRRPRTWWMLSRRRVDTRLCNYLRRMTCELATSLEGLQNPRQPRQLVQLRHISRRLQLMEEMLETNPTLVPRAGVSLDRTRIKEVVQHVERAVTAMEAAAGAIEQMSRVEPGGEIWNTHSQMAVEYLDRLANELQQRRALHI